MLVCLCLFVCVCVCVTHHSRPRVGHAALIGHPLVVGSLFVSEGAVEGLSDVGHAVHTHCIALEHVTEREKHTLRSVMHLTHRHTHTHTHTAWNMLLRGETHIADDQWKTLHTPCKFQVSRCSRYRVMTEKA